jgi:DNA-binding LacI/PurR family transcriptional regulator
MGHYLATRGHRRVAIVTGPAMFQQAMARADGFARGFSDGRGAAGKVLRYEGTYLPPSGREAVAWLYERHSLTELPSVVFFANYLMAVGALAEFYDRGKRIPNDIGMAVFGDLPELEFVRPNLTRVGVSPARLAERAVAMLMDRIHGRYDGPPRADVIPCALHRFESA